jgi:hypothetical protein
VDAGVPDESNVVILEMGMAEWDVTAIVGAPLKALT